MEPHHSKMLEELAVGEISHMLGLPYALKSEQIDVIKHVVQGTDSFALLPTGFGKTNCFAFVTLVCDKIFPETRHIAIVISPLRSLMIDQVSRLTKLGISCVAILKVSEMTTEQIEDIRAGKFSIILSSPEAAVTKPWWDMIKAWGRRVCVLCIDEAHCLTTWGSGFRPQYKNVVDLRSICPSAPILALTATATQDMVKEILESLSTDLQDTHLVAVLPNRPNIYLSMERVTDDIATHIKWLTDKVEELGEMAPKCIIYGRTIDRVTQIFGVLMKLLGRQAWVAGDKSSKKLRVELFHGSTDADTQIDIVNRFTSGSSIKIIVATVAFGMGIEAGNVEYIVHWGPAKTILNFWQEVGRAGRDGRPAKAFLYIPPHSLHPNEISTEMIEMVRDIENNKLCIRKEILSRLFVDGMSREELENCSSSQCCTSCDT